MVFLMIDVTKLWILDRSNSLTTSCQEPDVDISEVKSNQIGVKAES